MSKANTSPTYVYVTVAKNNQFEEVVVVPDHLSKYFVILEQEKFKANVRDLLAAIESVDKKGGNDFGRAA